MIDMTPANDPAQTIHAAAPNYRATDGGGLVDVITAGRP